MLFIARRPICYVLNVASRSLLLYAAWWTSRPSPMCLVFFRKVFCSFVRVLSYCHFHDKKFSCSLLDNLQTEVSPSLRPTNTPPLPLLVTPQCAPSPFQRTSPPRATSTTIPIATLTPAPRIAHLSSIPRILLGLPPRGFLCVRRVLYGFKGRDTRGPRAETGRCTGHTARGCEGEGAAAGHRIGFVDGVVPGLGA